MPDDAIQIFQLSKKYPLRDAERFDQLREAISDWISRPFRLVDSDAGKNNGFIWALKEIDLTVRPGETLGIIGRNGAGKSTLLKILSRVTQPTEGKAILNGSVSSLLEVGTGFHPDLTGRENIYLNAAILGMNRRVIRERFQEIVDFSEIGQFLNTQVKKYSSGMAVRLAFAIAAHLDSDIMLIDEVLAVGDASFQRKCLDKMESNARSGRTILFVSHNLPAIERLCSRCIVFDKGTIVFDGKPSEAIDFYYRTQVPSGAQSAFDLEDSTRSGTGKARFTSLEIRSDNQHRGNIVQSGKRMDIFLQVKSERPVVNPQIAILLKDQTGRTLFGMNTAEATQKFPIIDKNLEICCCIPEIPLKEGVYFIDLWMTESNETVDYVRYASSVTIVPNDSRPEASGQVVTGYGGLIFVKHEWKYQ
ncbi:MAG: ABC transporter ATP-binding protein [Candidatus Neomarinimicrobiota bacterium]